MSDLGNKCIYHWGASHDWFALSPRSLKYSVALPFRMLKYTPVLWYFWCQYDCCFSSFILGSWFVYLASLYKSYFIFQWIFPLFAQIVTFLLFLQTLIILPWALANPLFPVPFLIGLRSVFVHHTLRAFLCRILSFKLLVFLLIPLLSFSFTVVVFSHLY